MSPWISYLILGAIVLFVGFRWMRFRMICKDLPKYIREGALVVDVRSPAEFAEGNSKGSLNIPLPLLEQKLSSLPKDRTLILCCASGARSGMAVGILKKHGYQKVINAGPWQNIKAACCAES